MTMAFPMLAAMLTPGLLYAGLGAMAAPILIHLLARRRFKRIRWAAMEFLIDAERRNRRRLRMEEWLLLALRCLALMLLGLTLARPFLDPAGLAAMLRGAQRTERVFLLDDSFSMSYATAEGTSFDRAKLAVRRILELVRRETPDDTVTLVRLTDVEHPVDAGTFLDDTQTQELLARLEAITPTARSIDPKQVMRELVRVLDRAPNVTDAAIYILSDFQRHQWIPTSGAPGDADGGVFAPLKSWASDQRRFRIILVDVGADDPSNLAVTDLNVPAGQIVAGSETSIRVVAANFSQQARESLEVHATVGHLVQPSERLTGVSPGQAASVDLKTTFLRTGQETVRVELPTDALPLDNTRYLVAEVVPAIRMLVVNGDPSPDSFDDEITFLSTALRPEGEAFSGNELTVVDETQLGDTNLDPFHVVLLVNVYRLSDPVVEALERFVRSGGGLVIFTGDQVDPGLYNASLYRQGQGLLPAELTEVIRPSIPAHLILVDRLHPALRGLNQEGDPLGLGQVPFMALTGCRPLVDESSAETVSGIAPEASFEDESGGAQSGEWGMRNGESLALPAERTSRILARFDDPAESPALVERSFGRGRVLLITTSADKDWNAWPDHPTYLPVMMELTRYVARRHTGGVDRLVGSPIELEQDPNVMAPDALVRTPSFPNERETSVTGQTGEGRGLVFRWERTEQPGIYQFVLRRLDGAEEVHSIAVNVDPDESDLRSAVEAELRRSAGNLPLVYVAGVDKIAATSGEGRTELWRSVLILGLFVLLLEQSLAWYWGRRR